MRLDSRFRGNDGEWSGKDGEQAGVTRQQAEVLVPRRERRGAGGRDGVC